MKHTLLLFLLLFQFQSSVVCQTQTIINANSSWKYFNSATSPGEGWATTSYNDAAWLSGNTEAGYGDGGEATVLSFGPNVNSKYVSYYFRKSFVVVNPASFASLAAQIVRDDGAIVYLNGAEVKRSNMPTGTVGYSTLASSGLGAPTESAWTTFSIPLTALVTGTNVIAVEVHQSAITSSDLSFNFSLTAMPVIVCTVPSGLVASALGTTTATLSWQAVSGGASYSIQYKNQSASSWTTTTSTTNSKIITGLSSNTAYQFKVQTVCASNSSAYSAFSTFTTPSTAPASGNDTLINQAATWNYLDNGSNQGTAWKNVSFNAATWASGPAQLGYGDGDEGTLVAFGPNPTNRYVTTYFRKTFNVTNSSFYNAFKLQLLRDDGAVVYLNGTEILRSNMPSGTISSTTLASATADDSTPWYTTELNPALLLTGINTLAVELHQAAVTSSDISFNLRLIASVVNGASLLRGPYMNMAGSNRMTIRWKTDILSDSRIRYGTTTSYGSAKDDATLTQDHEVTLTGLNANTSYYYTIGSTTQQLQGDGGNKFVTAPATGSSTPMRFWVTGDFGVGSTAQTNVRNAFQTYSASRPANLWLWLGDNVYQTGTDEEFQSKVFNVYPSQFKSIPVHPSIGNHDYGNAGYQGAAAMTTNAPYFNIFTLPVAGDLGGVASGTEKYYSYNYGNIHFIVLDSYGALNTVGSPMYSWLQNDLAANLQRWTICYFHHPPYSHGSHNSDTDGQLINMRQNIIPLLENYHVDMVLCGHSHFNERSYFIRGHYSTSETFTNTMKQSASANHFIKSSNSDGCAYVVCGTSGQSTAPSAYPQMPAMAFSNGTVNCSLVIDVAGDSLNCRFLTTTGTIADEFSIVKQTAPARLAGIPYVNSRMSPNPLREFAVIETELPPEVFKEDDEIVMELHVTDVSGRELIVQRVDAIYSGAGAAQFAVHLRILPKGIYIYKLISIDSKTPVHTYGRFFVE